MNNFIQQLVLSITFPAGVRIGEGKTNGNLLLQSRDGAGKFVLRGTAVAGAVRHAIEASNCDGVTPLLEWFGSSHENSGDLVPSRVKFADSRLRVGDSSVKGVKIRNHNAIDRHRGAPLDGGLFSMESLPPGTTATLVITIATTAEESDTGRHLAQLIAGLFEAGLTLGGSTARGIGMAVLDGAPQFNEWNLADLNHHASWLDACLRLKTSGQPVSGKPISPSALTRNGLRVVVKLGVPRGQDFVVADGQGVDYDMEPQQVITADGTKAWLLPGSTLRGLFRAYISRLAAREGKPVADSYERWKTRHADPKNPQPLTGEDIAFGFASEADRKQFYDDPLAIQCPVMRLFGSPFAKGRIHIADAVSTPANPNDAQPRTHVAIDRFSGGANDGFLFDNQTLTRAAFTVTITVTNPTQDEANWIVQSVRAIDMGLIRVGSSKGAGRLSLCGSPEAQGEFADLFNTLKPMESIRG